MRITQSSTALSAAASPRTTTCCCCRPAAAARRATLQPRASLQRPGISAASSPALLLPAPSLAAPPQARRQLLLRCRASTSSAAAGGGGGAGAGAGGLGGGGSGGGGSGDASSGGGSQQPHPLRLWTFGYAALLALGGAAGYVKAGSTKSLTSALGSALILGLSARTMVGAGAKSPIAVCFAVALLLSVVMANRYKRSRRVMPAGVAAGASIAMSLAYGAALLA